MSIIPISMMSMFEVETSAESNRNKSTRLRSSLLTVDTRQNHLYTDTATYRSWSMSAIISFIDLRNHSIICH